MKDNHTPGPWAWSHVGMNMFVTSEKSLGDILNIRPELDTTKTWEEHKSNTRLITASSNSYHKNCGPHAVECAESDLLGECLGLCEKAKNVLLFLDTFMDENTELPELIEKLKGVRAKAILTKRKGDK